MHKLILGDSLVELKKLENESIDLIYADPPFNTKTDQKKTSKDRKSKNFYKDYWKNGKDYSNWLKPIISECHRILKKTGAIYVHCDWRMSHFIRFILDDVFKENNFRNEIIWTYRRWSAESNSLQRNHQNIYFYAKSNKHIINRIYEPYAPTTNVDQILQERTRDDYGVSVYKKKNGKLISSTKEKKGVPKRDIFEIPYLNPKAKERVDYPTQKPIELLKRIFEISSKPKDIVLDPFCGSGTTITAAKIFDRKCISIDINKKSIEIAKKRLENPIKSESEILDGYDKFNEIKNKNTLELKILNNINYIPVKRNMGIDGLINYKNKVVAIRVLGKEENFTDIKQKFTKTLKKKKCKGIFINNFNAQKELFEITQKNFIFLKNVSLSNSKKKIENALNTLFE